MSTPRRAWNLPLSPRCTSLCVWEAAEDAERLQLGLTAGRWPATVAKLGWSWDYRL